MPTLEPGRMRNRSATAAQWTARNPTLGLGEFGVEMDTDASVAKLKLGDGATKWNDLAYYQGATGATGAQGPAGLDGALSLALADASLVNTGTTVNPVLKVGDLSATYASATALAGLSDQQAQLMEVAATTDELTVSASFLGGWDGTTWKKSVDALAFLPMWIAPYACQVTSAQLVCSGAGVAKDATNFVITVIRSYTDALTSADAVTKATSDEAIVDRVAWSYAEATWDTDAATLAAGATVGIVVSPHGTATLPCPFAVTLTVQPT